MIFTGGQKKGSSFVDGIVNSNGVKEFIKLKESGLFLISTLLVPKLKDYELYLERVPLNWEVVSDLAINLSESWEISVRSSPDLNRELARLAYDYEEVPDIIQRANLILAKRWVTSDEDPENTLLYADILFSIHWDQVQGPTYVTIKEGLMIYVETPFLENENPYFTEFLEKLDKSLLNKMNISAEI